MSNKSWDIGYNVPTDTRLFPMKKEGIDFLEKDYVTGGMIARRFIDTMETGDKIGSGYGGFQVIEGDQNSETMAERNHILSHAKRMVPFAEIYMAPAFKVVEMGQVVEGVDHTQVYMPRGKNAFDRKPSLLIPTDDVPGVIQVRLFAAIWQLIEYELKQYCNADFFKQITASIIASQDQQKATRSMSGEARRLEAFIIYAERRLEVRDYVESTELVAHEEFFENVWSGAVGRSHRVMSKTIYTKGELERVRMKRLADIEKANLEDEGEAA